MDLLATLLEGARARGGVFNQTLLEPPWALRIADESPLGLAAMTRGHAWIVTEDEPVRIDVGDVAVVKGPEPFVIADDPSTPAQFVIHSGGRYTFATGEDATERLTLGVRTCGTDPNGSVTMLSGVYQLHGDVGGRLLAAVPRVFVVRAEDMQNQVLDLVATEVAREDAFQQAVLDRLLDLLLITTLRAWFARPDAHAPGWYRAQSDAVAGPALRLLHEQPAEAWTVATLAEQVGVSRAALARRFATLVGEPPMTYLANWRITRAADLLRDTDATLDAIARRVGYANAFALSVAFKRVRGVSPSGYRAAS